jgi:capsular polysaccharide biosynthesis protein
MDVPVYLKILWSYKWLLLIGLVVAAIAAMAAGFTIKDGQVVSRSTDSYSAATTVMVGSDNSTLYQAQIPGQTVQPNTTAPQQPDLSQTAVVYAYLISGTQIRDQVEQIVGKFGPADSLTAVRRTTQPGGNEQFPGRLDLPILDIEGISDDPARAEKISQTANTVFQKYVVDQQDTAKIADTQRVKLTTVNVAPAVAAQGSNPAIPIVATGVGVFLAFVALAFILYNARLSRERSRSKKRRDKAMASEQLTVMDDAPPAHSAVDGAPSPRQIDAPSEPALAGSPSE